MIRHILQKDARRLWPAFVLTLGTLFSLAWRDRFRNDFMPGDTEAALNVVLPIAWAFLLALAVEQEPIPGDRQFWLTRPYRRGDLLAAKLVFAAAFVHLPMLLADCWIVGGRGLSVLHAAPALVWKQAALAAGLTLPAMAMASLVRNFAHFVFEVVALAVLILVLPEAGWGLPRWDLVEVVRIELIVLIAASASLIVLALQYADRRVAVSRVIAAAASLTGIAVLTYLGPQSALAIRSAVSPAHASLALRLEPPVRSRSNTALPILPVTVTGLPEGIEARLSIVRSELELGSERYSYAPDLTRIRGPRPAYYVSIWPVKLFVNGPAQWMGLNFSPGVERRWAATRRATLRGTAAALLYRRARTVPMPAEGMADVPGIGRCTSAEVSDPISGNRLKVECESATGSPDDQAVLRLTGGGREWNSMLGFSLFRSGRGATWLSPVNRAQTSFNIAAPRGPSGFPEWNEQSNESIYVLGVPRGVLPSAKLEVTPLEIVGYAAVAFEFRDVDLGKYVFPPMP